MKPLLLLALALGLCHVLYEPLGHFLGGDVPAATRKLYYVLRGLAGMTMCGLLVYLAPGRYSGAQLALWNLVACWGFLEEEQTAACRLATWDIPVKQLSPTGVCSTAVDSHIYLVVLAASLAWIGMRLGRQAWSSKGT